MLYTIASLDISILISSQVLMSIIKTDYAKTYTSSLKLQLWANNFTILLLIVWWNEQNPTILTKVLGFENTFVSENPRWHKFELVGSVYTLGCWMVIQKYYYTFVSLSQKKIFFISFSLFPFWEEEKPWILADEKEEKRKTIGVIWIRYLNINGVG